MPSEENPSPDSGEVYLPGGSESIISGAKEAARQAGEKLDELDEKNTGQRFGLASKLDAQRLIRLDKVCIGIHLMAARWALKDQPNGIKKFLKAAMDTLQTWASVQTGKFVIKKLSWRGIPGAGAIVTVIQQIKSIFEAAREERAFAEKIRLGSFKAREDVIKNAWNRTDRKVITKWVNTRHFTERQRLPNKAWRSPKS